MSENIKNAAAESDMCDLCAAFSTSLLVLCNYRLDAGSGEKVCCNFLCPLLQGGVLWVIMR